MYVFVLCLISGVGCGIFFDIQRSLRRLIAAGGVRTAFEDTAFAVVCVVGAIGLGFLFNNGQMRYYQVMGVLSGALFYAALLSSITMKILAVFYKALGHFFIRPVVLLMKTVSIPFVKIFSLAKFIFKKLKGIFLRGVRVFKTKKKTMKKRMKML